MLPRASGRYFNHASVKRNSLPDQAGSRSAWFFFLGQVNCQFKHLLSQDRMKTLGAARTVASLATITGWPQRLLKQTRTRNTWVRSNIWASNGQPSNTHAVVVNTATHSTTAKPIAQSPLKPRTAFSHCPLVIQPQWLVWTCDDHSSVHINCLMNN